MDLFFEMVERLTPRLRAGDLAGCEAAAVDVLRALPRTPFHVAADLPITNDPADAARHFDRFYRAESERLATLNRTLKSYALAIVGAEYILRWLPRGTHDWEKFVTPAELEAAIEAGGLSVFAREGVAYNPLADRWSRSRDLDVNYMLAASRPA